jgi:hypothetical protein
MLLGLMDGRRRAALVLRVVIVAGGQHAHTEQSNTEHALWQQHCSLQVRGDLRIT